MEKNIMIIFWYLYVFDFQPKLWLIKGFIFIGAKSGEIKKFFIWNGLASHIDVA
jgi:hypothetical protein